MGRCVERPYQEYNGVISGRIICFRERMVFAAGAELESTTAKGEDSRVGGQTTSGAFCNKLM